MNFPRTLLFSALLALICSSSFAVTITQNEAIFKDDDPRLDQRVSYSADGLRLADVMDQLTQQTSVVMSAGSDKQDWQVYDRKLILYVKDMKLRDLMQEISRVLSFHWSRGGDAGKWTYKIWQDKDQGTEEDWLRSSSEDAQGKAAREKRENAVADMANLGSLGSKDAGELKQSDPWRYILATEPLGKDVAQFLTYYPEAHNAFVRGLSASFPVSTLSPELQATVRRIAESYDALTRSIGASEDHSKLLANFDKLQITINRQSLDAKDVLTRSMLGRINIGTVMDSMDIPLFDPSSPVAKAFGMAVLKLRSGGAKDAVGKELQSALESASKQETPSVVSARDVSSDPALRDKVKLFDDWTVTAPLPDVLKLLATKTGLNVLSDYFPVMNISLPGGTKTLGEQLEAIRASYGSNWEKSGNVIRFRDQEWFKKRAWEVPQVWIDYWIARGKTNNGLQLDDLAQIGALRDEQIDHTVMSLPVLVRMGAGEASANRQILRFYFYLSKDEATQLTAQELPVSKLDATQWKRLQDALATKGAAYAAVQQGQQTIKLTQSGTDIIDHVFTFSPGGGDAAVAFKVSTGAVYMMPEEAGVNGKPQPTK